MIHQVQEENQRGSCLLLWTAAGLKNEPGGRSERAVVSREEERARGEREANWLATVTGRDIVRRGRFLGN